LGYHRGGWCFVRVEIFAATIGIDGPMNLWRTYFWVLAALCLGGMAITRVPAPARSATVHLCACATCPGGARCCCLPKSSPGATSAMEEACDADAPVLAVVHTTAVLPTAAVVLPVFSIPAHEHVSLARTVFPRSLLLPPPSQPPWTM
jgi:hypothetical protein